jgi:hypothetical protein
MKYASLIFSLILASFSQAADKAVVQQMKGRRAILQFEKDIPFSVGQKVYITSEDGTELGIVKELRNPLERKNSISLAATMGSVSTKPKPTSIFSLQGRYGWNMERFELGPLVNLTYNKTGSAEVSTYEFGGFFDFNMIPNRAGEDIVWGPYGEVSAGTMKYGTASGSLTSFTGGAFVKLFLLSPDLAVRLNGYYRYELDTQTTSISTEKDVSTIAVAIALMHYF